MNRREFGKQSSGMIAVAGGLAATGCVKHPLPPLEPKVGDKIIVKYNYRSPFESRIIAICSPCSWSSDGNAYHCYLPDSISPHSKARWCLCSRDQIEVIAKPEPKIGDKVRCSRICAGDNTPVTLEPCVSEIRMIERIEFAKCTRVRYACLLPVSAGFSGVSECGYCTREEIEVIA